MLIRYEKNRKSFDGGAVVLNRESKSSKVNLTTRQIRNPAISDNHGLNIEFITISTIKPQFSKEKTDQN